MRTKLCAGLLFITSLATCSLHAAEPSANNEIALQMYTLRSVGDAAAQFAMAHKAGFKNVELVGNHGISAKLMNELLKENQLTPVSAHVQLAELENNYDKTVAFNKAVGNKVIIVPWIKPMDRPDTAAGWKEYGQRLNKIGEKLRRDHIQLAYHNHNFEMKKYEGKTALEIIFDNAQPQNLLMEMDVGWVSRGGQDPAVLLNKYSGRVYAIHAKDNAPIGVRDDEMNFAPFGEGILDWKTIIPAAKKSGVRWFIIEHDAPKDPWSIITASYKNLSTALSQKQ